MNTSLTCYGLGPPTCAHEPQHPARMTLVLDNTEHPTSANRTMCHASHAVHGRSCARSVNPSPPPACNTSILLRWAQAATSSHSGNGNASTRSMGCGKCPRPTIAAWYTYTGRGHAALPAPPPTEALDAMAEGHQYLDQRQPTSGPSFSSGAIAAHPALPKYQPCHMLRARRPKCRMVHPHFDII